MKTLITATIVALFAAAASYGVADESKGKSEQEKSGKTSQQSSEKGTEHSHHAYLGVAVEALPSHLASHLSKQLGDAHGLLVVDVADDSPADKAGLEPDDILVKLDDHNLNSPEQFIRAIRHDKAGEEVKLAVIHNGESKHVTAKLGERPADYEQGRRWSQRPNFEQQSSQNNGNAKEQWLTFDSMTLTRSGKDKFKAEIKYRNDDGKLETHSFQGTREELRKDITSEKDLPKEERGDLLRALDLSEHPMGAFPGFWFQPNWFEPENSGHGSQGGQGNQWQRDTVPWR